MFVRQLMTTAASGAVIALGVGSISPVQAQGTQTDVRADSLFIRDVASTNLLEIQLGKLAQQKAANSAVKEFGKRLVGDHTNLELQWFNTISKHGMTFRPGLSSIHQQQLSQLQAVSGAEFDRAFMTAMIQGHETAVSNLQSGGQSAHSTVVRDLATSVLPVVEQHLSTARQIGGQVGVTTVATATPTGQTTNPSGQATNPDGPVTTQTNQPTAQNDSTKAAMAADSGFIREVETGNLLEERLGQLAETRSTNSAVKQFAQRMVTEHTNLQSQWTGMASSNGLTFSSSLDPQHQQKVDRLQNLSGNGFDRAYMSTMIHQHQADVNRFQNEGTSARSAQVRTLVTNSLAVLQQHLTLAKQVGSQVRADTTGTSGDQVAQGKQGDLKEDHEFIRHAITASFMEIRLGQIVQNKATNESVKRLGQQMVTDHTRMQDQWLRLASRNGMELKPGMGELHRQKVDRVQKASGKEFDRIYLSTIIEHHEALVPYFQKESRSAQSAPVRRFADDDVSILRQDLNLAKRLGNQIGADGRVSVKNGGQVKDNKK